MNTATRPLRDVAQAVDMKPSVLRQLYETGVLKLRGDDKRSTGSGVKVGLSKNRAYEAAIVQRLKLHGVPVSRGANAAFAFTINGGSGRAPGQLYPIAKTILLITPTEAVVANVDPDARVSDLSNNGVAIVVDLNKVVADVDAVLNSYN